MEEEKAAAYYDELTRKGEGAARYKQGLGYSSNSSTSLSLRTTFVPASSHSSSASELQQQSQILHSIQDKLKKNKDDPSIGRDDRNSGHPRRSREEKEEDENGFLRSGDSYRDSSSHSSRHSRRRSSSREGRESYSAKSREGSGRDAARRRSRSRSRDDERSPASSRHRRDSSRRSRNRSLSPTSRRSERERIEGRSEKTVSKRDRSASTIHYAQLIEGYAEMTPAERVKAKMKLQLSQTAAKDTTKGMTTGWERFDFNKEAPLDDEEIEVAEDDAELVKGLGKSFRFSAVEAKREAKIQAAHDEAIFGTSTALPIVKEEASTDENLVKDGTESSRNLMSDQLLMMQQGSWRDRARKFRDG